MAISSRFAVSIHILTLIELNKEGTSSSEFLSSSVNTNPAVIRKIMSMLKKAGLIEVSPGIAGAKLTKELSDITLFDVYKAVNVVHENGLFSIHDNPNPDCLVGKNIQQTIEPIFLAAQSAMEEIFKNVTLNDVVKDIADK
ncbi:Rrf2 family transcriptional regulator [Siminovitchia terrae]|uniref:Rrf2 family transcriptional regulator n=1 Tax=Siminovitchia terrae TaxID=1914933 RepID=A0A429X7K3_SIMTE|nr:Rrf2 family transcriptional regulator [Siminovitchia terrae]RST59369.1 Rrf2 family transcriptional regulator [Siminovitchia terrae]GIN94092.1 Rrf2 family transcriptional regulator [Siminovitchia terrae]GIN97465.1 Rrf2 family transcriptional regulator [Siminovitchia terrae]